MRVELADPALVLLVGPTGTGKSTFARQHFQPTEVLSSDAFRAMLADDEADQASTADAFEILHQVAARRLANRRLTVVDATNVQGPGRRALLALAARYGVPAVALVFDLPEGVAATRNRGRPGRVVPRHVLRRQYRALRDARSSLGSEGFANVVVLRSDEDVETLELSRAARPSGPSRSSAARPSGSRGRSSAPTRPPATRRTP